VVLPCTRLPHSQEFYEEGINFYRGQGADSEVFVFSTTSGLVIPREFRGDASKNHYRYRYFTQGILGETACLRFYQWERYRTAKEFASAYLALGKRDARDAYLQEARDTLGRFSDASKLAIYECDHFDAWKDWHTLVGPQKQQLSIRPEKGTGAIGHGVLYDAAGFKRRSDLFADFARLTTAAGVGGMLEGGRAFVTTFGPAMAVAASACALLGLSTQRIGQLIRDPILDKCRREKERPGVRVIKAHGESLKSAEIAHIVDELLNVGQIILKSERKAQAGQQ